MCALPIWRPVRQFSRHSASVKTIGPFGAGTRACRVGTHADACLRPCVTTLNRCREESVSTAGNPISPGEFVTLYENLALPLDRLTKKSQAEIDESVDRVLGSVGLAGDKRKMPAALSGGMRKRAGLARALVLEPKILLADEPSSGLDRITASEIDDLLLRQKREHGTTILVVTHDVHGARRVGDLFAVFDKGDLIAFGPAAEVERSENETARLLITEY